MWIIARQKKDTPPTGKEIDFHLFSVLAWESMKGLRGAAVKLLGCDRDDTEADDLVSDAIVRAFKVWRNYRHVSRSGYDKWLIAIMCNLIHAKRRAEKVRQKNVAATDADLSVWYPLAAKRETENSIVHRCDLNRVVRAVEVLEERERLSLVMRFKEEFEFQEIADVFGVTTSRARRITLRGIFHVKQILGLEGSPEDDPCLLFPKGKTNRKIEVVIPKDDWIRPPSYLRHGTRAMYADRKCRCAECVGWNRHRANSAYEKKKQLAWCVPFALIPHGTSKGYQSCMCRCDKCLQWNRDRKSRLLHGTIDNGEPSP